MCKEGNIPNFLNVQAEVAVVVIEPLPYLA
jgi:hypothetical protein